MNNKLVFNLAKLRIYQPGFIKQIQERTKLIEKEFDKNFFVYYWEKIQEENAENDKNLEEIMWKGLELEKKKIDF